MSDTEKPAATETPEKTTTSSLENDLTKYKVRASDLGSFVLIIKISS